MEDRSMCPRLDDGVHVDGGKRFAKFITAVPIDVLPGDRRYPCEQRHPFCVSARLFEREEAGEDAGIVRDDAVSEAATTFPPEVLVMFGAKAQLAKVGIGDRPA